MMLRISLQGVTGFPLRSILVFLTLLLAVSALVATNAAARTIENTVLQRALLTGGPTDTFRISIDEAMTNLPRVEALIPVLERMTERQIVAWDIALNSTAVRTAYGDVLDISVKVVSPDIITIRPFALISGEWISNDERWLAPRACVNAASAHRYDIVLGSSLSLNLPRQGQLVLAVVSCVVEDGDPEPQLYFPDSAILPKIPLAAPDASIAVQLTIPHSSEGQLMAALANQGSLTGRDSDWSVSETSTVERLESEVGATKRTFEVVGIVGLLMSILAIANVGLSAVRERSIELSLRRAVGARRWHLAMIVVLESQIIAVAAGLVAVPFSALIYPLLASQFGAPYGVDVPEFPFLIAGAGALFGMLAALMGTLPAAIRSWRVPIADVMRE